jgi:PAS domain S-box-containing protein
MKINAPHADQALQLIGNQRFELLIQSIRDYAVYLLDVHGYVNSWNPGAQRFKGYTADEIIGQHFSRFYTPEDRARDLPATALRIAAEKGVYEAEGWRVRKDGTRFWTSVVIDPVFNADGTLIGYAKVTRDIGDKKAAQEALRASEERFSMLVQGVRDYAIYMISPEGLVTNWNTGAQAIKGYEAQEVIGTDFARFYTPEDREEGLPAHALATALREGKFQGEGWRVRKDGTRFWASVVLDAIHDPAGKLVGYAKITRDITERREAQLALDRSRDELNQAQKMEAIGRITGGVAHDFNNLLTIIRSSAELLRRADLPEEKRTRYLDAIADTSTKAALLTRQLLAFSRKQALQPEIFDVVARLHGMEHIIGTTIGVPIHLSLDFPAEPMPVEADPNQFETAVLNIVINARDAMPQGGTLRVQVRPCNTIPPVRNHAGAAGQFIAVSIADTGTGIPSDVVSRIFEPFFTTKPIGQGTGQGLAITYAVVVDKHDGTIDVSSIQNEGTTFTITLPLADADAHESEPATSLGSQAPLHSM